jgi:hypothetical protein
MNIKAENGQKTHVQLTPYRALCIAIARSGGLRALSRDTGVARTTLSRGLAKKRRRAPYDIMTPAQSLKIDAATGMFWGLLSAKSYDLMFNAKNSTAYEKY